MKVISKYLPYFYFVIAGLLFMNTLEEYGQEKLSYDLFFSWKTESSTTYLTVRIIFVFLIILAGIARIKRSKQISNNG